MTTARVLLDLAGLGFVAVALVLASLHVYGALYHVAHGRAGRSGGGEDTASGAASGRSA